MVIKLLLLLVAISCLFCFVSFTFVLAEERVVDDGASVDEDYLDSGKCYSGIEGHIKLVVVEPQKLERTHRLGSKIGGNVYTIII